ncbi:MAG TPA: AAA family ATPase [Candidatus Scybalocola faecipullorum]|nr:AAA family ATPase [Candidatus Scybalocola faecipullorum]
MSNQGNHRSINTDVWFKVRPSHSLDDIAGMEGLKSHLRECGQDSRRYFFCGSESSGLTYIIEAFVHELMKADYRYLSIDGSEIAGRYQKQTESAVKQLFETAQENAPCIVAINEVEYICPNRASGERTEQERCIADAFLDGFRQIRDTDQPVIIICSTNHPNRVDKDLTKDSEMIQLPDLNQ